MPSREQVSEANFLVELHDAVVHGLLQLAVSMKNKQHRNFPKHCECFESFVDQSLEYIFVACWFGLAMPFYMPNLIPYNGNSCSKSYIRLQYQPNHWQNFAAFQVFSGSFVKSVLRENGLCKNLPSISRLAHRPMTNFHHGARP